MSLLIEKISKIYDIQRYNDYSEFTMHNLKNIRFRFNDDYIYCIDIEIDNNHNFINNFNINLIGKYITSIESLENIYKKVENNMTKEFKVEVEKDNDYLFLFNSNQIKSKNIIDRSKVLENFKKYFKTKKY